MLTIVATLKEYVVLIDFVTFFKFSTKLPQSALERRPVLPTKGYILVLTVA